MSQDSSESPISLKELLLEMPDVGEDKDFERPLDRDCPVDTAKSLDDARYAQHG